MTEPDYILTDKRVLITGASSGLGAWCAVSFARRGAIVAIVARRQRLLLRLKKELSHRGVEPVVIAADIMKPCDVHRIRTVVNKKLGGCDIVINNAGIYLGDRTIGETNLKDWTRIMDTNLRAPYLLCKCFLPGMLQRGHGRIINIISGTSDVEGVGIFRISKIGLEVLTSVVAAEIDGSGIAATAFNPGWMKTETSNSGRSPAGAARAITEFVQRQTKALNGKCIDLRWTGRDYRLCVRAAQRGKYGV